MSYQTYQHNRNFGCRITELILAGHRCITLENERLRVTIIADKGADIYEFLYKPRDIDFMWRTWVGLRDRSNLVPTSPRAVGAHMDYYEGGWQELFPNCGSLSLHQGAEVGQHGEVLLLAWRYQITKDDPEEIAVRFEVRTIRTPFHLSKVVSLRRDESVLRINERVTNESGQEVHFTWGQHPAFGWPFVEEGCRVDLPDCKIRTIAEFTPSTSRLAPAQTSDWPIAQGVDDGQVDLSHIPGPEVEASDMVFLQEISDGWYAITNTRLKVGFALRYPADVFKQLWYWQVYRGGRDYPWWSSTYNIALEPCATLPVLSHAAARGEALSLGAGESMEINLMAIAFEGLQRVTSVNNAGRVAGQ